MVRKNEKEKLESIQEKIKKLEAQKSQLQARIKDKERKARTRRLIQIGAIFNSIGFDDIELADKFKNYLSENQEYKELIEKFLSENKEIV